MRDEIPVLHFELAPCSLGLVLVAAGRRGILSISLGDEPAPLLEALRRDFPGAGLRVGLEDDPPSLAAVCAMVEDPGGRHALSLAPCGTPFQQRVWRALCALAPGTTSSYGALAVQLGRPGAARAVAAACAANRLAVAVPCHRVIRADGGLAGYRWGVERKYRLLERERSALGGREEIAASGLKSKAGSAQRRDMIDG